MLRTRLRQGREIGGKSEGPRRRDGWGWGQSIVRAVLPTLPLELFLNRSPYSNASCFFPILNHSPLQLKKREGFAVVTYIMRE